MAQELSGNVISSPKLGLVSYWLEIHSEDIQKVGDLVEKRFIQEDIHKAWKDLRILSGREQVMRNHVEPVELVKLVCEVKKEAKFKIVVEAKDLIILTMEGKNLAIYYKGSLKKRLL